MKFPIGDPPVRVRFPGDVDYAGGAKIRPGHLFLARPVALYRLSRSLGETRCFESRIPGVFTAVAGTGIRHDHAHLILRHLEVSGELATNTEGALRTSPDSELRAFPLGKRRARLKGNVRDVGDVIGGQAPRGRGFAQSS